MPALAAARASFVARVNDHVSGQGDRFVPALDELIRWSHENGLEFDPAATKSAQVRFRVPGERVPVWTVTPRGGDGGKLTVGGKGLGDARRELARIDGKPVNDERPPEVSFAKLIWRPYRAEVLAALGKVLTPVGA